MGLFSFDDYDDEAAETPLPYDEYLTVKAFLEMHFGDHTGGQVYNALLRMAKNAAAESGGCPGLIFNDEGGEFVSFSEEPDTGFSVYPGEDD
jgi:hypothetical protein